jgi:hypothetical protein
MKSIVLTTILLAGCATPQSRFQFYESDPRIALDTWTGQLCRTLPKESTANDSVPYTPLPYCADLK